jgi:CheY-like chemotaxis protein
MGEGSEKLFGTYSRDRPILETVMSITQVASSTRDDAAVTTDHSPLATHQILVCDDEAHILHAVSFKLSAAGFRVLQAGNGRDAIALLQSHTPDLVVTDYQMPFVDGFELCRFLRSRPETAHTPIILLTAKALELDEQRVRPQWNLTAVFMKPFSPRALLQAVQQALQSRAAAAAS